MTKDELIKEFDLLQEKFGSKTRNAVYGGGCENKPDLCLVFINPTAKNVATSKTWKGIRRQWLGTKLIWDFLTKAKLFDDRLNKEIQSIKASEWTEQFCEKVYEEVEKRKLYITNLAKCTQDDARELPNAVFEAYRDLFLEEMKIVKPKAIVLFGNQVSSIVLEKKISVSKERRVAQVLNIGGENYICYSLFYPVGNGRFNMPKAIEDLLYLQQQK